MILAKSVLLFILMQSIDCLDLPCSFLECVADARSKVVAEAANKKEKQQINIANQVENQKKQMQKTGKSMQTNRPKVSFDCAIPSRALCAQCSAAHPDS